MYLAHVIGMEEDSIGRRAKNNAPSSTDRDLEENCRD
jgi:hypothetical protein